MYHKMAGASAENLAASLPRQRAPADWASVEASHRLRSQARKLGEIAESLQDAQPPALDVHQQRRSCSTHPSCARSVIEWRGRQGKKLRGRGRQ